LIRHFLAKFSQQFDKPVRRLTQRAGITLGRYNWPGNVRELENVPGHGCMMTMSEVIDLPDLPSYLTGEAILPVGDQTVPTLNGDQAEAASLLENNERRMVSDALSRCGWNQSEAARILRIGRDALRYKMKKYGLTEPSQPA
jgi:DNA-binding NtrC family response regulator